MSLDLLSFVLGPLENNTYILADTVTAEAVVIDPSFDIEEVVAALRLKRWNLTQIWLTHAHFDHTAGAAQLSAEFNTPVPVGLHPADLPLLNQGGGAANFGLNIPAVVSPTVTFEHGQLLQLGSHQVEVRYTPGHTAGHVIFYASEIKAAVVGDLIFAGSIGRTDLPGGSMKALLQSIEQQVFSLPQETRLLSGHGPATTVGEEMRSNPYLS